MDEDSKQLVTALKDAAEQRARADRAEAELATTKAALTSAQTDAANARADAGAEKKKAAAAEERAGQAETAAATAKDQAKLDADSGMSDALKARLKLLTDANRVLGDRDSAGKDIDRTSMDELELELAVITQVDGADFVATLPDAQKKDPVFVAGLYAGSLARFDAASTSRAGVRSQIHANRDAAKAPSTPANDGGGLGVGADAETRERQAMIRRNSRSAA